MWTVIGIVTAIMLALFFALLSLAGTLDPNPRDSKPPSNGHV